MSRRLPLNDNAFSRPLGVCALYWAGVLAADGCVCLSGAGQKCVGFTSKDRSFVEDFRRFLLSDLKVKELRGAIFQLDVYSTQLFDDLVALGITPRKSLNLKVVGELSASPDFWRGAVDGDGCIHWQGNTPVVVLSSSSIAFAGQFQEFCGCIGVKSARYVVSGTGSKHPGYQVRISGCVCRLLLEFLYRPSAIALHRKKILAEEVLEFYSVRVANRNGWYNGCRLSAAEISVCKAQAKSRVAAKYYELGLRGRTEADAGRGSSAAVSALSA